MNIEHLVTLVFRIDEELGSDEAVKFLFLEQRGLINYDSVSLRRLLLFFIEADVVA